MKALLTPCTGYHRTNLRSSLRIVTFVILVALIGIPLFSSSSATSALKMLGAKTGSIPTSVGVTGRSLPREEAGISDRLFKTNLSFASSFSMLLPQGGGETIATFEYPGCTVPKDSFNLGETVCAIVSGAPLGDPDSAARRISWVSPYGSVAQGAEIITDPQTGSYAIPLTATQTFTDAGGGTVTADNRGQWRIYLSSNADNSLRTETTFTVHDPAKAFVDLYITQDHTDPAVGVGSSGVFELFASNFGPDTATAVVLSDTVPSNTESFSITDHGSGFSCGALDGGIITCTLASLPVGVTAHLTLNYSVMAGTSAGTILTNLATISSSATPCAPDGTCEIKPEDNSSTATALVPTDTGTPTCSLDCPNNVSVTADTSQDGNAGAFVTYPAAQPQGSCGAVSNTPGSGSFFTVGTHTVTSNSESGDTCTFQVTVNPPETEPPTITCPVNKTVTAASGATEATVDPGTPTTNPSTGVTVVGVRSDNEPGNCDPDPCPPKPLTDPYPLGVTFITWTVTNSTAQSASCIQRITVNASDCGNDTTPPTIVACGPISAEPGAEVGTACAVTVYTGPNSNTCGVALSPSDDELGSPAVSDGCSVTVTSDIPTGGLFPVGTTTVHYTATDGSGNSATATQTVIVIDNTAPEIAAPADASYTCPGDVPAGHPSQAHGTNPELPNGGPVFDNCGSVTVTVSDSSTGAGSAASPKIISRTFTATDSHGNSASAVQTITVIDPTPPTITSIPANATYQCASQVPAGSPSQATATDNCAAPIITVADTNNGGAGSTASPLVITRTYTATDAAGNSSSAAQTITVIDNTPPVITCQADIIADFDPAVNGAVVTYTAPVGTDNCAATTTQIAGLASGSTFPVGTTTNTFRVTDAVGQTAQCSFKVTVAVTSIIGLDSVTMTGAGYADSYSSAGGYPATKGSLANILSNGTITMGNSAKIWGNARSTRANINMTGASQITGNATAGTTVTTSGSASVGGTRTNNALAPVMTLPSVPACSPFSSASGITGTYSYNATTGNLTLSGVNIATLANGTYCFNNVTIGNSAQLKVNGPVVIKLKGTLNTSGASSLNNTTQIPSNLRILSSYSGSNGVVLGNSASVYALIYAPNTGLNLSGAAPLFGTFAGKTLVIGSSGAIHYDTQLKAAWPAIWALL